ncbi:zonular occludens toxin domain-containing protein [Chromobacterium sp. IIBBL 290-4]|uniref:zonular occludens toxin domain-containing protein n=1 Tax=Chromobacterium sp. IIBBL 290-4 TaxID=2953890 RepID=UPI0020B6A42D|nr:zonular occludens toxin domain-containing protein [Chromobacterium sp. IIBBL 290-4]UTH73581.1 hypothetical protein NKT35_18870 [Chromobacterium sp. IIBBL 290-4]
MAMSIYCGLQGSGKSYETVKSVIIPAIAEGRRVVCNIRNISQDKIHALIRNKKLASPEQALGDVVTYAAEQARKPDFFFDPEALETSPDAVASFVAPGDLIVVDEAWEVFGTADKITAEQQKFFRMHRHYADKETGRTCDIVLITQDVTSLHRFVRGTIQQTFRMKKHTALGKPDAYSVTVFEGCRMRKSDVITQYQEKYDADYFGVYDSHVGGNGKELQVDSRATVYTRGFKIKLAIAAIAVPIGFYGVFDMFWPYLKGGETAPAKESRAGNASAPAAAVAAAPWSDGRVSLVGFLVTENGMRILIRTPEGTRLATPSSFTPDGFATSAVIDGRRVYFNSAAPAKSGGSLFEPAQGGKP